MKAEDKSQIMQTLTTLTNSITKLQEEIKGLSSANVLKTTVKSKAQVHTHAPKYTQKRNDEVNFTSHVFCSQAQKELLDTELDLYKKMQAGEDTADLKIKYTRLQLEVFHGSLIYYSHFCQYFSF